MSEGRRKAIESIVGWLLACGVEDEDRWVHMMQVVNEAGRFVFGFPHLESSESDIFGALDDIALQLEGAKNAIEQTTREARIAQSELHKALEPLLPEGDAPLDTAWSSSRADEPASNVKPTPGEPADVADPARDVSAFRHTPSFTSLVDAGYPSIGAESDKLSAAPEGVPGGPVVPTAVDEGLFAAIRKLGNEATYEQIAAEAQSPTANVYQRLKLLATYDTLPADIVAWRACRRVLRDVWWLIVKDGKEMERTGHAALVRWARAGLGLDERLVG